MDMADSEKIARRKRINQIKKMILLTFLILLMFPTVASIILLVRLGQTNRKLSGLETELEDLRLRFEVNQSLNQASMLQEEAQGSEADGLESGALPEENNSWDVSDSTDSSTQTKKQVCLTFDDGPSIYTGVILDILETYGVKATFFVVGRTDENSLANMQRIVEDGHTIGMHSYSHKYSEIYASQEAFQEDFEKIRNLIVETTGTAPQFYRFPGGSSNTVSQVPLKELEAFLTEQGITYFDWNISGGDATGDSLSVEDIVRNATGGIESNNTSVILLHDSADKYTTVRALPSIIETILDMEDVELVPITEKTNQVIHN